MRAILFILVGGLCSLQNLIHGQVIQSGDCPEFETQKDFKLDDYMGTWYEYAGYPRSIEKGMKCMQIIQTKLENGTVNMDYSRSKIDTGVKLISHGTIQVVESGKILLKFPEVNVSDGPNYWVLGTNYKDYSVVFYCRAIPDNKNAQYLWILTRERNPNESVLEDAYRIIDETKLTRNLLTKTDQTNCPDN